MWVYSQAKRLRGGGLQSSSISGIFRGWWGLRGIVRWSIQGVLAPPHPGAMRRAAFASLKVSLPTGGGAAANVLSMTILPIHPAENASADALRAFLGECRAAAQRDGHAKLVSISLAVDALDPLAVLESIFEPEQPHFYAERPASETAIAGAEIALAHEAHGAGRFATTQAWIDDVLGHTIAVGDVGAPFGGPHFFAGFAFHDEVERGEAFPAAFAFVPRWQVALAGATTTAVANLVVTPDVDLTALTERVWRAHGKFRSFGFSETPDGGDATERRTGSFSTTEAGDYRAAVARALERSLGRSCWPARRISRPTRRCIRSRC